MNIYEFNDLALEAILVLSMKWKKIDEEKDKDYWIKENDLEYWIDELSLRIKEGYYGDKSKKEMGSYE